MLVSSKNIYKRNFNFGHIKTWRLNFKISGKILIFWGLNQNFSWELKRQSSISIFETIMIIFDFDFRATFGGKWACLPRAPMIMMPTGLASNPAKKLAQWVDLLVQLLSRIHVFEIFNGDPLPLNPSVFILVIFVQIWHWNQESSHCLHGP